MKRTLTAGIAVLAVAGFAAIAIPSSAADAGPKPESTRPVLVRSGHSRAIPVGARVRVWGKAANGKRFSYSYVEGRTRHTRLPHGLGLWASGSVASGHGASAKTRWRTTATTATFPEAVPENEEVVPVNAVSTWVLPSGDTVGR